MNNLELKSMGVQELDTNEMVNLDGGGFLEDFFLGKAVDIVIDSIMYSINNPEPGWNSTNYGHYGGARP
ncbi:MULTISPECIES: hypothetical protein [Sphingobacterium]|jgi:hypothetical protein|uniref:hypothetical protein n=1 Tax=Sphingobacterium TaxID=28453 RepID=UPI00038A3E0D|nr:hypothetical protein [Sphingobacterium sp. IITKGP-BTPF85]KKX46440.1 hypothetical protein L950_0231960 [Sphingobacterium sp. IITKGP-BTPF85]